jgi:hypothetical protein
LGVQARLASPCSKRFRIRRASRHQRHCAREGRPLLRCAAGLDRSVHALIGTMAAMTASPSSNNSSRRGKEWDDEAGRAAVAVRTSNRRLGPTFFPKRLAGCGRPANGLRCLVLAASVAVTMPGEG